jgi:hypothetical protein
MSRSDYTASILASVARRERDAAISKRIDEVLAEPDERDLDPVEDPSYRICL